MDSPIDSRDLSDPGDDVSRRYRYQHAYGVVLSVGIATGRLNYTALWCEQHEDYLAETNLGLFDAFQIKTKDSELGEWQLNDTAFLKTISRFVKLDLAYPNKIRDFNFVSNTRFSDSNAAKTKHLSPHKLLRGIKSANNWDELVGEIKKGFDYLKNKLSVESNVLFSVLKRLEITVGLTYRAFEDELCQRHIATLDECKHLSVPSLSKVSNALIAMVAEASSLVSNDPSREWIGLTSKLDKDPFLLGKKVTPEIIKLTIREVLDPEFCFLPELASLHLGDANDKMDTLKQKMYRGGLASRYEVMRRRSLTAEYKLLDLATRPIDGTQILSQIENVVLEECDDAHLRASQKEEPYGPSMLIDVQDRLKIISENNPTKVHQQPYDLLIGVAGLLTSECKVWWSSKFELEVENESKIGSSSC